jgi:Tfp pilus assembly protein PilF
VTPAVARLLARADSRLARGDMAGARDSLENATALEPRLSSANALLAQIYEQAGEIDKAIDRYRIVIARAPNDFVSLNNLAYDLAVRKNLLAEGLALAERAYAASKAMPTIADTLGWIHFLLGHQTEAERFTAEAAKGNPDNAEIQLHVAKVLAAGTRKADAAAALDKAIQLDRSIETHDDVKELRSRLGRP